MHAVFGHLIAKNDINLIEAVQRRVARFAIQDIKVSLYSTLQELDWTTLHKRRDQMKLIMMYKIIHGLVYIQQNLPLTYSNLNNISRRHPYDSYSQPPD